MKNPTGSYNLGTDLDEEKKLIELNLAKRIRDQDNFIESESPFAQEF